MERERDAFCTGGTSPTSLDSATPATVCTMRYAFRIRTAKPHSRPGRWISSPQTFATFEGAGAAADEAAILLMMKARCRVQVQVLNVVALFA